MHNFAMGNLIGRKFNEVNITCLEWLRAGRVDVSLSFNLLFQLIHLQTLNAVSTAKAINLSVYPYIHSLRNHEHH